MSTTNDVVQSGLSVYVDETSIVVCRSQLIHSGRTTFPSLPTLFIPFLVCIHSTTGPAAYPQIHQPLLLLKVHGERGLSKTEGTGDLLERGVGGALSVVVPHVVERGELGLGHDGVPLGAGIVHGWTGGHAG